MADADVQKLVDHLFRRKSGQLVATLTRIFGSSYIEIAENVVQEAFLKACQTWPYNGIPDNPEGWLTTVAKNAALDVIRKEKRFRKKEKELIEWFGQLKELNLKTESEIQGIIDNRLTMMFLTCHPCLTKKSQICLTLKIVGGFSVGEIGRAFLSHEEATKRLITRAKQKIRDEDIRFELPSLAELSERIDSVLNVLYLIFNEGYSAYEGDALIRKDLCDEAIWLTSLFMESDLSDHPKMPSIKALLALMLLQSSRLPARINDENEVVLLADQDRSRWDQLRINAGLSYLEDSAEGNEITTYHLEAHIAAAHAMSPSYEETDWKRIVILYDKLFTMTQNPIVQLNRIVAISMVSGIENALDELKQMEKEPQLEEYYLLPATFADFYFRLNQKAKALKYYQKAISLVGNAPEQRFLERRIAECRQ